MTQTVDRSVGCSLHRGHSPEPTYLEAHHIIPQAWQATWRPDDPGPDPAPSPDHPSLFLWDGRTAALCRTGHGNVHYWIVAMMKAARDLRVYDVPRLMHEVRSKLVGHVPGTEDYALAASALIRFQEAGGDLATLIRAHQWGTI